MTSWVFAVIGVVFFAWGLYLERKSSQLINESEDTLREATDAYRSARHDREEAYRILTLAAQRQGTDNTGEKVNG